MENCEAGFASNHAGGRGGGEWHSAVQAGVAQALAERLAYCLLSGPEVKESCQLVGLVSHPRQLGRVEPALGQGAHLPRVHLLHVHAEGAGVRRGDGKQVVRVTDAHLEAGNVRPAGRVVAEDRAGEECAREGEQEFVGRETRLGAGRRQPDMYGITHRKKVTE
jgi:hypothetical protein